MHTMYYTYVITFATTCIIFVLFFLFLFFCSKIRNTLALAPTFLYTMYMYVDIVHYVDNIVPSLY